MKQVNNNDDTQKQVLTASYISIAGNGILSVAKLIVGFISGSFAVISDGIDSASDVAISIVMAISMLTTATLWVILLRC